MEIILEILPPNRDEMDKIKEACLDQSQLTFVQVRLCDSCGALLTAMTAAFLKQQQETQNKAIAQASAVAESAPQPRTTATVSQSVMPTTFAELFFAVDPEGNSTNIVRATILSIWAELQYTTANRDTSDRAWQLLHPVDKVTILTTRQTMYAEACNAYIKTHQINQADVVKAWELLHQYDDEQNIKLMKMHTDSSALAFLKFENPYGTDKDAGSLYEEMTLKDLSSGNPYMNWIHDNSEYVCRSMHSDETEKSYVWSLVFKNDSRYRYQGIIAECDQKLSKDFYNKYHNIYLETGTIDKYVHVLAYNKWQVIINKEGQCEICKYRKAVTKYDSSLQFIPQ